MKRILAIFLLSAVVSAVQAQTTISGHVRDGDGKPVEAVPPSDEKMEHLREIVGS